MARPSKYNQSLGEKILSRYADGETLTQICKDDDMPKRNTVYRWRSDYPKFGEAYLLAQEQHVDALVDEAGHIVDTEQNPKLAKSRAEHRRWLASRLNRQKYGDKLEVSHSVSIDIAPALQAAMKRMELLKPPVLDVPVKQLVEAENSDTDTM
ncbi:MAG: helix-turn-helix domain-containing protein [Planctomycetota bacterium]|jgi:hypothetical protein